MCASTCRVPSDQKGATLVEVLITLLVIAIGLLGIAALQVRLQSADIDSYQRAHAMVLLEDIANRIEANRGQAASYVTGPGSPTGVGVTCATAAATRVQVDLTEWCKSLQGASELVGANKRGAMLGGRGCVEAAGTDTYRITVAWQGLGPVAAPPVSVACGANLYDGAGCTGDRCRRVLTTLVRIADLI